MKKLTRLFIATLVLGLSTGSYLSIFGDCPECNKNVRPMPGSGAASDGSGRREITVRVGPNLESPPGSGNTNANVWNALQGCAQCSAPGALSQWNNARDQWNNSTGYHLKLNQTTGSPDITIVLVPSNLLPPGSPAASGQARDAKGNFIPGKRIILLTNEILNWSQEDLAAVLAHEIGHLLGLADKYGTTGCATILNQGNRVNGRPLTKRVQPNDVEMVNKQFNEATRHQCTHTRTTSMTFGAGPTPTPTPTPVSCIDNDQDGLCAPQDCNDNSFWSRIDFDGDGYCDESDCNDYDPYSYPGAPLDTEPSPGDDRNCNDIDDYREVFCSLAAEQQCRAAGKDWDASHCTCSSTPILLPYSLM